MCPGVTKAQKQHSSCLKSQTQLVADKLSRYKFTRVLGAYVSAYLHKVSHTNGKKSTVVC